MILSADKVAELQSDVSAIRNICIMAHVDHGKTSLSDSLLATNGIISQRLAGKIRYLDSREDEQLRGITMASSTISLYFRIMRQLKDEKELQVNEHLINLIDSPGHIDFSSEVSTAARLCDGAVVLVDVVEGVCSQTINVLHQCWADKLKPLLVINKIDRLITEWKMDPLEAYQHISKVVEQVNSVIGSLYVGDVMADDLEWREKGAVGEFQERDDENIYFDPAKGNVLFASAIDSWAFSVSTFAKIYAAKLGFSYSVLCKTLWGDFYLDMKNKKIIPRKKLKPSQASMKPLFVSLILEQIWAIYENCVIERNQEKIENIISKLGSKVAPRDLRSKDSRALLTTIMSSWIPLSHSLLSAVIECLPNPREAQRERVGKLIEESVVDDSTSQAIINKIDQKLIKAMENCDSSNPEDTTVAYVSKMISVSLDDLPGDKSLFSNFTMDDMKARIDDIEADAQSSSDSDEIEIADDEFLLPPPPKDPFEWEYEDEELDDNSENEEDKKEVLIAFSRIFSGSLREGQKVTVVGPKYDPSLPNDDPRNKEQVFQEVEIKGLFLFMGRDFIRMQEVPAGNIVGIAGFDNIIMKNATILSGKSESILLNLSSTSSLTHHKPIMRIAVEPSDPSKLSKFERGLDVLAKSDPVLEWYIDDESGEFIMCVAGELHLERCLKDLEERFAKGCEVTVKEPLIPFREGITKVHNDTNRETTEEPEGEEIGLDLHVYPLPDSLIDFLVAHENEIQKFTSSNDSSFAIREAFKAKMVQMLNSSETPEIFGSADELVEKIVAFGPRSVGPNILVETSGNKFKKILVEKSVSNFEYDTAVLTGFQLAAKEGPLAHEPLHGLLIAIGNVSIPNEWKDEDIKVKNRSGRVIIHTREMIHKAILSRSPRLLLAMYTCDIQASAEVLGKVYSVVQKRGGAVISEDMKDGMTFFVVKARLPVIEAFGFSEEIRKKTSGAASPQLVFDGYDILDIDPFWVPHTEEELEELGEFEERDNIARKYMNNIRRKKGLFVDEKVVKNAEKQRTLKKD